MAFVSLVAPADISASNYTKQEIFMRFTKKVAVSWIPWLHNFYICLSLTATVPLVVVG